MASQQNGQQPSAFTPDVVQKLLAIARQQQPPAAQQQLQSMRSGRFDSTPALELGMQPPIDLFGGDNGSWSGSNLLAPGNTSSQRSSSPDLDIFSPDPARRNASSSPYAIPPLPSTTPGLLPDLSDMPSGPSRRLREPEIFESDARAIGSRHPNKRARTTSDASTALGSVLDVATTPDVLLSPYRRPTNPRSVELFSGPSKQVFTTGETEYQLWIAGFPDRKAARDQVDKIFRSQIEALLQGEQRQRRRLRLQSDSVYRKDGQSMIRRGAPHIRGEIIRLVRAKGPSAMGFGGLKKEDIKLFTKELLGSSESQFKYNYHFSQLERQGDVPGRPNLTGAIIKRSGAYRHPLIAETLATVFFLANDALAIDFPDSFNPMPLVSIALVAAAMECVINEWSQGFKATHELSQERYGVVFKQHLDVLETETAKPQNKAATDTWLAGLFAQCRSLAKPAGEDEQSRAPLEIASDEFAWDDDFGAVEKD